MTFTVTPANGACGASITDIDLRQELTPETIALLRQAWLEHKVLAFPDQDIDDDDLERFSQYFGEFAGDPFIASIDGRDNVIELRRRADETTPIFADSWHTDWSFGATPPAATILYGLTIPPHGGNTEFINQELVLERMPADLRERLQDKLAKHSAQLAYSPDGLYGEREKDAGRGFKILTSDSAYAVQSHPIIRRHPETGQEAVYGCFGYIIGVEDCEAEEEAQLLGDLYNWQTREEFVYSHEWQPGMLVMWDNRSVLHRATGGYEGYERVLHRTVVK